MLSSLSLGAKILSTCFFSVLSVPPSSSDSLWAQHAHVKMVRKQLTKHQALRTTWWNLQDASPFWSPTHFIGVEQLTPSLY